MQCSKPRTVGFKDDGKTISWSQKQYSKEFATFQLPCGKCLECRLDYSRQWAVRCVHEAMMHEKNCFITLTYSDKHLKSPKLIYSDFQNLMKKIRKLQNEPMGVFVTGEYGEKDKRPHWHAIIFNWEPTDLVYLRTSDRGDKIWKSETLDRLWGKNDPSVKPNEVGSVTFHSAGYVARYAAKKLVHGFDANHDYHPISKKSQKHAIGKKWLEKFWPDAFNYGRIVLPENAGTCSIPRYYEKWFKENHPERWLRYVTETKQTKVNYAQAQNYREKKEYWDTQYTRDLSRPSLTRLITPSERRQIILRSRFRLLQQHLKL